MVRTGRPLGRPLAAQQRLVLRLWPSGDMLTHGESSQPLWVGTVVTERLMHMAPLATIVTEGRNMNFPLQLLHDALHEAWIVHRRGIAGDRHWTGDVLLGQS